MRVGGGRSVTKVHRNVMGEQSVMLGHKSVTGGMMCSRSMARNVTRTIVKSKTGGYKALAGVRSGK